MQFKIIYAKICTEPNEEGGAMGCIIGDFKSIVKSAEKISRQELKSRNLPVLSQHIIIFHLIANQQVLFNKLQRELQYSKSTLSDAINRYEDLGLIEKIECVNDKRNLYVRLTDNGLKVWAELCLIDEVIKAQLFKDIAQEEKINIETGVHQMMENIR